MVRFLGIIRQNKLETFCTFFCCLWQKILQVSSPAYKYFSSPVEEVALAEGEYLLVIHRSAMLGGPTQPIGKTFYLGRTSSLNLIPDCRNQKLLMECFQQVHLLFNRQHNLIYCLSRRKFPTLFPPFHYQPDLAQTYLSLFPQSHAGCFIKKKKSFQKFFVEASLWRLSMYNSEMPRLLLSIQPSLYFPQLLQTHELSSNENSSHLTWSVQKSDTYRVLQSVSSTFYVSNDVNLHFSVFQNTSLRSHKSMK